MRSSIIPREEVARRLSISPRLLLRYERRGLIRVSTLDDVVGYEPDQIGRLLTIVSLQRDLGVNLAGVEAILQLRSQMNEACIRLRQLARELMNELDQDAGINRHG